jgi:hypothetical protein
MPRDIGVTGLDAWSGEVRADFLREFIGKEAYKRFNEMRLNSPVIGALMAAYKNPLRAMDWPYQSTEGEDDPRLEVLNRSRDYMTHSWQQHIQEGSLFLDFGFSLFSVNYQRAEDNAVLWRQFKPLGQNTVQRWLFDDAGGVQGFVQQAAPLYKTESIDIHDLILYRVNVERNNPEGRSILRQSWFPYYYAKNISAIEAIGIERDAAGLPVIKLPQNATTDEDDSGSDAYKAAKFVRNIRNDEQAGFVLPFGWELALLASAGGKQIDTDKVINRYHMLMLMSAHAQFLLLGQEGVGSYALSADQSDFFTLSLDATADIITETQTQHILPRLLALNGYEAEGITQVHSPASKQSGATIAATLSQLANQLHWSMEDEIWLRGILNMPEVDPEVIEKQEEEKRQKQAQALAMAQAAQGQPPAAKDKEANPNEESDAEGVPDEEHPEGKMQMTSRFKLALDQFTRLVSGKRSWNGASTRRADAFKAFGDSMATVLEATAGNDQPINVTVRPEITVTPNITTPAPIVQYNAPPITLTPPAPTPVYVTTPPITNVIKMPRIKRQVQTMNRDSNRDLVSTESKFEYEELE